MTYQFTGARPDEVFVGNVPAESGIPAYLAGLKTARIGDKALDIEGRPLSPDHYLPLFIGRTEADAYDRIMMKRAFPNRPSY